MPMTLPINCKYKDQDAQTLLENLPLLQAQLTIQEEDEAFLRRFLRRKDVQATMKSYKSICILNCRKLRSISMASVAIAANVFCDIRKFNENLQASELMTILSKPNFQALLYTHDMVAKRDFDADEGEFNDGGFAEDSRIKIVQLVKKDEALGVTIQQNERGSIEIARILHGGAAYRSGLIHVGDEILEINGIQFTGRNPDDMANLLTRITGPVTLKIVQSRHEVPEKRASNTRVKALFDYNPYEDALIPCQNAGLPFKRGDILHIVSQEDPLWWQAKLENNKDSTTGIIPARLLQESVLAKLNIHNMVNPIHFDRRDMLQDVLMKKEDKGRRSRSVSPCRTSPRIKRVRKVMYRAVQNGEFELGDIPTYEEVELIRPDPINIRPIVLIGVSNVGRNELKQRLISSNQKHYVDVVPYTSRPPKSFEEQGREYHFITRNEMESAILARRFVEHGEFRGHLYGTRTDSIMSIIKSGRVPILTPSAKALRYIRVSEIKPYIIFIKPPSSSCFKETREKANAVITGGSGELKSCSEDIISAVITKSAKVEEVYGHFFDSIIINDDISRASRELIKMAESVETDSHWVPVSWVT